MHVNNPWKSYRQVATQTASPGQLVLMLYEGALSALRRALPGFECDDPGESITLIHNNVHRATEIIRELNRALNFEQGGDCAKTLHQLYDYFERRLWESNMKKQRDGVEEVIKHLTILREAWATMLANQAASINPEALSSEPVASALA